MWGLSSPGERQAGQPSCGFSGEQPCTRCPRGTQSCPEPPGTRHRSGIPALPAQGRHISNTPGPPPWQDFGGTLRPRNVPRLVLKAGTKATCIRRCRKSTEQSQREVKTFARIFRGSSKSFPSICVTSKQLPYHQQGKP